TAEWQQTLRTLVLLLAPIGPYISEELWELLGQPYSIHKQAWPQFDAGLAADEVFTLVVQVNGKVRERIEDVSLTLSENEVKELALSSSNITKQLAGKKIITMIYVPHRL